jgi:predicted signal transduction protein with EAL and GGDEF domain
MAEWTRELQLLGDQSASVSVPDAIAVLLLSFVLTMTIGWVYRLTHRGVSYSQSYVHTLVILGTVISLIMLIIGSSVARAFTLVGAMSIIRFRNAMKETRDVAFVFMAMAVGMAVGVRFYMLAIFATIVLCALIAGLTWLNVFAKDVRERILRVQLPYNLNHDDALAESFRQHTEEHRVIAVETVRAGTLNEVVYSNVLKHRASTQAFMDSIRSRNENHKVTLILGQQEVDM